MRLSSKQYKYVRAVLLQGARVDLAAMSREMSVTENNELANLGVTTREVPAEAGDLFREATKEVDHFLDYAKANQAAAGAADTVFSPEVLATIIDALRTNALFDEAAATGLPAEGEQFFLLALGCLDQARRHLLLAHYAQARAIAEGQRR